MRPGTLGRPLVPSRPRTSSTTPRACATPQGQRALDAQQPPTEPDHPHPHHTTAYTCIASSCANPGESERDPFSPAAFRALGWFLLTCLPACLPAYLPCTRVTPLLRSLCRLLQAAVAATGQPRPVLTTRAGSGGGSSSSCSSSDTAAAAAAGHGAECYGGRCWQRERRRRPPLYLGGCVVTHLLRRSSATVATSEFRCRWQMNGQLDASAAFGVRSQSIPTGFSITCIYIKGQMPIAL